jgi:hypothetical protein
VRTAIAERFRRYPSAADTARGMLVSWLPERGLAGAPLELVERVVKRMVRLEWLRPCAPTGGEPLYRRGPRLPGAGAPEQ